MTTRAEYYTELLMRATIDHFALQVINDLSLDYLPQSTFEALGGNGLKPAPLSFATKTALYVRIDTYI